jgi:hypothetical protein
MCAYTCFGAGISARRLFFTRVYCWLTIATAGTCPPRLPRCWRRARSSINRGQLMIIELDRRVLRNKKLNHSMRKEFAADNEPFVGFKILGSTALPLSSRATSLLSPTPGVTLLKRLGPGDGMLPACTMSTSFHTTLSEKSACVAPCTPIYKKPGANRASK